MRALVALLLLAALCSSCASSPTAPAVVRVLFVGNSLTYVGNLPAVFDGLAKANDRATQSSMIAAGGATLTQRVADGSVERTLASGRFEYLVLQERGGDYLGGFGEEPSKQAEASLSNLAATARKYGVKPILLGTYQLDPDASTATVAVESDAARKASVPYISVSNHLHVAMGAHPEMQWLFSDGGHPGHDLILLDAALLFQRVFGIDPVKREVHVSGPMYVPSAKFGPDAQPAQGSGNTANVPAEYEYTAEQVARIAEELR